MWRDAGLLSKGSPIINTGFGGSTAFGLNHYLEDLVLRYKPKQVFIYEGDNDIDAGRETHNLRAFGYHFYSNLEQNLRLRLFIFQLNRVTSLEFA